MTPPRPPNSTSLTCGEQPARSPEETSYTWILDNETELGTVRDPRYPMPLSPSQNVSATVAVRVYDTETPRAGRAVLAINP